MHVHGFKKINVSTAFSCQVLFKRILHKMVQERQLLAQLNHDKNV